MFILHGSWLLTEPTDAARGFVLWAETDVTEEAIPRKPGAGHLRAHPFAAPARALKRAALELLPGADDILKREAKERVAVVQLPSTRDAPQSSPGSLRESEESGRGKLKLAAWQVDALLIPPHAVPGLLLAFPAEDDTTPGLRAGADLRFWQATGKFALELLARQRFAPRLLPQAEHFLAQWQPLLDEPADAARVERLAKAMPPLCRALSLSNKSDAPAPRALLDNFLLGVVNAFARWHTDYGRYQPESGTTVADAWLDALTADDPIVRESAANVRAFYEQYRAWTEPIPGEAGGDTFRLCFRLDPPPIQDSTYLRGPKSNARDWTLIYFLQATDDPSLLVPHRSGLARAWQHTEIPQPQIRRVAGTPACGARSSLADVPAHRGQSAPSAS